MGRSEGHVELNVRDDGKGISEDQIASTDSLGLIGMRERATAFGASSARRTRHCVRICRLASAVASG